MGSSLRKSSSLLGLAIAVAVAISAPSALAIANPPTEPEYVATVEPICKSNAEANSRILTGVKQQVQKGQLAPAGKRVSSVPPAPSGRPWPRSARCPNRPKTRRS